MVHDRGWQIYFDCSSSRKFHFYLLLPSITLVHPLPRTMRYGPHRDDISISTVQYGIIAAKAKERGDDGQNKSLCLFGGRKETARETKENCWVREQRGLHGASHAYEMRRRQMEELTCVASTLLRTGVAAWASVSTLCVCTS